MDLFFKLPFWQQFGILYLALINILAFFIFGWDKFRARVSGRRVSEAQLWLISAIGGSLGALFGMHFFRHKTKKLSFQAGIAIILCAQILIAAWVLTR